MSPWPCIQESWIRFPAFQVCWMRLWTMALSSETLYNQNHCRLSLLVFPNIRQQKLKNRSAKYWLQPRNCHKKQSVWWDFKPWLIFLDVLNQTHCRFGLVGALSHKTTIHTNQPIPVLVTVREQPQKIVSSVQTLWFAWIAPRAKGESVMDVALLSSSLADNGL